MRAQPKLQSCVPFTPVTGARILIRHGDMRAALTQAAAQTLTRITGASFLVASLLLCSHPLTGRLRLVRPRRSGLHACARHGVHARAQTSMACPART